MNGILILSMCIQDTVHDLPRLDLRPVEKVTIVEASGHAPTATVPGHPATRVIRRGHLKNQSTLATMRGKGEEVTGWKRRDAELDQPTKGDTSSITTLINIIPR